MGNIPYEAPKSFPPDDLVGGVVTVNGRGIMVDKKIAQGGYGFVYLAHSLATEEKFVLKKMVAGDKMSYEILKREVELMKEMRSPHIVACHGVQEYPQDHGKVLFYVLMEYCQGGHLLHYGRRLAPGSRIPESSILTMLEQVVGAVDVLHSRTPPVAHRDLKLENILVARDRSYRLCDFGSTSLHSGPVRRDELGAMEADLQRFTTAAYRAPEQVDMFSGEPMDERVDIWAIGCIVYTVAFAKHPFADVGNLGILNGRYTVPSGHGYSDDLLLMLRRCLQLKPDNRPSTKQLLEHISHMKHDVGKKLDDVTEDTSSAKVALSIMKSKPAGNTPFLLDVPSSPVQMSEMQRRRLEKRRQRTRTGAGGTAGAGANPGVGLTTPSPSPGGANLLGDVWGTPAPATASVPTPAPAAAPTAPTDAFWGASNTTAQTAPAVLAPSDDFWGGGSAAAPAAAAAASTPAAPAPASSPLDDFWSSGGASAPAATTAAASADPAPPPHGDDFWGGGGGAAPAVPVTEAAAPDDFWGGTAAASPAPAPGPPAPAPTPVADGVFWGGGSATQAQEQAQEQAQDDGDFWGSATAVTAAAPAAPLPPVSPSSSENDDFFGSGFANAVPSAGAAPPQADPQAQTGFWDDAPAASPANNVAPAAAHAGFGPADDFFAPTLAPPAVQPAVVQPSAPVAEDDFWSGGGHATAPAPAPAPAPATDAFWSGSKASTPAAVPSPAPADDGFWSAAPAPAPAPAPAAVEADDFWGGAASSATAATPVPASKPQVVQASNGGDDFWGGAGGGAAMPQQDAFWGNQM